MFILIDSDRYMKSFILRFSFFFFTLFSMQLFAAVSTDDSAQLQLPQCLLFLLLFLLIGYWIYKLKAEINYCKKDQEKLRENEILYRTLTEDMEDVIWKTDKNYYFTYISSSVERKIGYTPNELIGHHIFEIFTDEGIATVKKWIEKRQNDVKNGRNLVYSRLEIQHKCKDGSTLWGEIISKPELDADKNIIGYHGISRDITERKALEDKILELAFYDPLTQLPNRRLVQDRLKQTIASSKRSMNYAAIIYLDLDNFKPLNDTYGHSIGDLLLIEVAHRLKNSVREMDTVARVGGDEFIVIVNELDKDEKSSMNKVNILAKKILSSLSATYTFHISNNKVSKIEHNCSASIGIYLFKADKEDQETLLQKADKAMYEAKETGRNKICFYK